LVDVLLDQVVDSLVKLDGGYVHLSVVNG
jgi:hypothetical protein